MLKCNKERGVGGAVKTPLFLLKKEPRSETEPFLALIINAKANIREIVSGLIKTFDLLF